MGDHLALLVDRLLTEATLEAAIGARTKQAEAEAAMVGYCCDATAADRGRPPSKMVECRICQEEDWDSGMEAPCGCRGSLKYAHRKCIQRWCNEKGDTICEICLQKFRPGYTSPQQLFHYGTIPMNFRGNWEIARQDLHDSQVITMVPSERDFMDDYEDYLPVRTRSSALCCRTIAIIFMALLVLRHTLPLVVGGDGEYSFTMFSLLVLRTAGILFPILVMVRAVATYHRRRRQQAPTMTRKTRTPTCLHQAPTMTRKKRRISTLILHGLTRNHGLSQSTNTIKFKDDALTEEKITK